MKEYRIVEKVVDLRYTLVKAKNKKEARALYQNGVDTMFMENVSHKLHSVIETHDWNSERWSPSEKGGQP